jgi:L-seryl-tRNA(Ser) seleniumtransferase
VALLDLVKLGTKHNLPVVYDMGSGLLRKSSIDLLKEEPDVKQTLALGVDLVTFSGDKLIGGPQAGIIAGKSKYISALRKEPMVRALRVGKTTIAFMEAALNYYLDEASLIKNNSIFGMLHQTSDRVKKRAQNLQEKLVVNKIESSLSESEGYCGGGAMPGEKLPSFAVKLEGQFKTNREKADFAEKVHHDLLNHPKPVVGILKKGELYFDVLTLGDQDIEAVAAIIADVMKSVK